MKQQNDVKTYVEGFIDLTKGESLKTTSILKQSIKFNLWPYGNGSQFIISRIILILY